MVATAKQHALGEITTLLGRGASFEGKLTFDGTVRIDGRFKGELFSDDTLVIGESAVVEADIDIGEVIVQGTVIGNIKAKRSIEIHAPGRVKGDLHIQGARNIAFGGAGPEAAYAHLVDALVSQVTRDMHATWERRRIPE